MMRWRSDIKSRGKRGNTLRYCFLRYLRFLRDITLYTLCATACQKPDFSVVSGAIDIEGNVLLRFSANGTFSKVSLMLFDSYGDKVFDNTKTQSTPEFDLQLEPGRYIVVAVGHSSPVTPSIKSPQQVTFTASDGRKLSDTFCYVGTISVDEDNEDYYPLAMQCATAAVRFEFTDTYMPQTLTRWQIDYTGGSANVNPYTLEGITKSSQSEICRRDEQLQVYTFPYLSDAGTLKMTVSALDVMSNVLHTRTFQSVPVTRGSTTTLRGEFFTDGDVTVLRPGITFVVEKEWGSETVYEF